MVRLVTISSWSGQPRNRVGNAKDAAQSLGEHGIAEGLKSGRLKLSVVIAMMNEEDNIAPLYERLKSMLISTAPHHEVLFVDDGSTDSSFACVAEICDADPSVEAVRLRRHMGKAAALAAGFASASGDIVMTMDADLQDQPEEAPKLIDKLDKATTW